MSSTVKVPIYGVKMVDVPCIMQEDGSSKTIWQWLLTNNCILEVDSRGLHVNIRGQKENMAELQLVKYNMINMLRTLIRKEWQNEILVDQS